MFVYVCVSLYLDPDNCPGHVCVPDHTIRCVDGLDTYTCECILGYEGDRCQDSEC